MVEQAYQKYQARLLTRARKQLDRGGAEDVVQQTFIDLMRCECVQNVEAFLYTSLGANIVDRIRSDIHYRECPLREAKRAEAPWERSSYEETYEVVQQAIAELPQPEIVEGVLCGGLSYSEAAKQYRSTAPAVAGVIHRARKRLRHSKLQTTQ